MLTIQKLEKGYGAFIGIRLIAIEENTEGYQYLINSVIRANKAIKEVGDYNV